MDNTDMCCVKLEQIRSNWDILKQSGRLRSSIAQLIKMANMTCSVDDVIDIEESIPEYLNKLDNRVADATELKK
jgi:hypothetical protein